MMISPSEAAAPAQPRDWVRDRDLLPYMRCPYAWWLVTTRQVTFADTVDDLQKRLLRSGKEFHEIVRDAAVPLRIAGRDADELLRSDRTILNFPRFFHDDGLVIHGRPDGVACDLGRLIPIEIKSHKDVQRIDRLELAFYWLVLEPYRTRAPGEPHGLLVLRRDGRVEQVTVPLGGDDFDEVRRLVAEITDARRAGVRPRVCDCPVCGGAQRNAIEREIRRQKDLTMIFGIGRAYAQALESVGCATWEDLLDCDPATVRTELRARGYCVSEAEVAKWKQHARSYRDTAPIYFGDSGVLSARCIALDLEYQDDGHIWLIGLCIREPGRPRYEFLWADDPREEADNIRRLARLLEDHPTLPVITWAGRSADLPKLRAAGERLGLGPIRTTLEDRHRDLYLEARASLRLPEPRLGLKAVAEYFEINRQTKVSGGLEAQAMYASYRRTRNPVRKTKLRDQLLRYNREDLRTLVSVAERMRALSERSRASPVGRRDPTGLVNEPTHDGAASTGNGASARRRGAS
jgi:predicted RecB family nuclease